MNEFCPPNADRDTAHHTAGRTIGRIVGVYDADSSYWAELVYLVTSQLGRRHCALCDITHKVVRTKQDWRVYRDQMTVPLRTYHRDDQPEPVRMRTGDVAPVVVAEVDDDVIVLLSPNELSACHGSVADFDRMLRTAIDRAGLRLPATADGAQ